MRAELTDGGARLRVRYASSDELEALLDRAGSQDPVLRLEQRLEEGVRIMLDLGGGDRRVEAPAVVKQIFRSGHDRFGTIVAIELEQLRELEPEPCEEPTPDAPEPDEPEDAVDGGPGETLGASVQFEIRDMLPPERIRLAAKASRQQRQVLLRDRSPQVLMGLLNNPRLETTEVLEMVKNPKTVAPVLQRVAQDRRYAGSAMIQAALVKNPNTPSPVALRLVAGLPTKELRALARSQSLRETVRKAALRAYLQRM